MVNLVIDPRDPELAPLGPSSDGSKYRPVQVTVATSRDVRLTAGGFVLGGAKVDEQIPVGGSLTVSVPATDGAEILEADRSTFEYVVTLTWSRVGKSRDTATRTFRGLLPTSLGATVQVTELVNGEPLPAPYTSFADFEAAIGDQIATTGTAANDALIAEVGAVTDPATAVLVGSASATRNALDARYVALAGRSVSAYAYGVRGDGADYYPQLRAALNAAEAQGGNTVVELPPGVIGLSQPLTLAGYHAVSIEGAGASFGGGYVAGVGFNYSNGKGTVLKMLGPQGGKGVIDFEGYYPPESFRGWMPFGGFTIVGDGANDPTGTNAGIRAAGPGMVGALSSLYFHDIVISATGGPCITMEQMYACHVERVTCTDPINAMTNNVPWAVFKGVSLSTFTHLGFQSMKGGLASAGLGNGVGTTGVLRVQDGSNRAHFHNTWFQHIHLPVNGTYIDASGNGVGFHNTTFMDEGLNNVAGGNAGTSIARLRHELSDGLVWNGFVPGGGLYESGLVVEGNWNRITGTRGIGDRAVVLKSGASYNYIELGGSQGSPGSTPVQDDSGNTTNTYLDSYTGKATRQGYRMEGTGLGPRFLSSANATQGYLMTGNAGTRFGATGVSGYIDANTLFIRNIAGTQAFKLDTTPGGGAAITLPHGQTAFPAASATHRGKVMHIQAAAGAADQLAICVKDAADAYSWVSLI